MVPNTARGCQTLIRVSALSPQPDEHEDLYRIMHHSLDELEAMGAIVAEVGYYCRLCLGYQELRRGMPAVLERGRKLCPGCCRGLVDGALDGKVHVPITIPGERPWRLVGGCRELMRGVCSARRGCRPGSRSG